MNKLHLILPLRHTQIASGMPLQIMGYAQIDSPQNIEYRFAGGVWQPLQGLSGAVIQTQVFLPNGYGRFEVRFVGDSVSQSIVEDIEVAPTYFERMSSSTLIAAPASGQTWLGRPILLRLASGVWLLLYRQATNHGDDVNAKLHLRFSTDEGNSWTADDQFTDGQHCVGAPFFRHNTTLLAEGTLVQAPNGDILVLTTERAGGGIHQYRSTDQGKTWVDEGRINNDTTLIGGDSCVVGTTIYAVWRYDANSDFLHPHIAQIFTSSDSGRTWTKKSNVQATLDVNEPSISPLDESHFLVIIRNIYSSGTAHQYLSSDTCATWVYSNPGAVLYTLERPKMLSIPEGILLYGRGYNAQGKEQIVLFLSPDGGLTWCKRFVVDGPFVDGAYCDILRRGNGDFYMVSYAGDTNNAHITTYLLRLSGGLH